MCCPAGQVGMNRAHASLESVVVLHKWGFYNSGVDYVQPNA